MIPTIAILAALSMVVQDILATILVIAEAKGKAVLSGAMDSLAWFASILTTAWSVTALQGHMLSEKVWILVLVTIANFVGSYAGVKIGHKITGKPEVPKI